MMAMLDKNLVPDEIVVEILARLPVKSLVRFRCVSKSWHHIISDRYFIQKHLNTSRRAKKDRRGYLLLQQSRIRMARLVVSPDFFSFVCDETFVEHIKLENPFDRVDLVGYSNGLLCFSSSNLNSKKGSRRFYEPKIYTLYVWNPAIRRFKTLSHSLVHQSNGAVVFCFCYVPHSNDYKVLKISYCFIASVPPEIEVYSLNTNSWKRIQDISCRSYHRVHEGVVNEGIVHWAPWIADDNGFIVTFDMGNESFGEMKLPDLTFDSSVRPSLMFLGGCLCLCLEMGFGVNVTVELWVMKEYGIPESWTKCFIFSDFSRSPSPIGFLKNGETVLEIEGRLFSYDPTSQQIVSLPIILDQVGTSTRKALLVTSYMETLVLL